MSNRQVTEKQVKLLTLADYIEQLPDVEFDMRFPFFEDGAGCIACHAEALFGMDFIDSLEMHEFNRLCMPPGYEIAGRYTKSQAVSTLRHFAITGKVDWSVAQAQQEGGQ